MRLFLLIPLLALSVWLQAQLQDPSDFLPHQIGAQFTLHHQLVDYMQHAATESDQMILTEYGKTSEDRPLLLGFISSEENLSRLEAIRTDNLRRTGLMEGKPDPALQEIAIVWLSFSVHGNEAATAEASMPVVYALLTRPEAQEWLKNTVILIDPTINPDGYSRYTHWYRSKANRIPNPSYDAIEHQEPWPGGRVNHYLFDLNRDWAWQTQHETRQRMEVYHQWMPHIHVDFHEQGVNSPYYFAPAARPYHAYITDWQKEFQTQIGKNHSRYFAEEGWLFFTKERFDLLYPSYGDTYPTYNGAIGMTYEQGGSGRAGRQIIMENGDTLTLHDRVAHHLTTALSTVEVASQNSRQVIDQFENFFKSEPPGAYKSFIIPADQNNDHLQAFTTLLDRNHILYGRAGQDRTVNAYDYRSGTTSKVNVKADDLLISARQPKGVLAQILLEPNTFVEDSATYDITAWSLPYAFGLQAFASESSLEPTEDFDFPNYSNNLSKKADAYAYLASWGALKNASFLAALHRAGIRVRVAGAPFGFEGKNYLRGTLVITRADNRKLPDFPERLATIAAEQQQAITAISTGFAESGSDLGSSAYRFLEIPRVAVLTGEGTSVNGYGQVWHFFEQEIEYPFTALPAGDLGRTDLSKYNVLVMPGGRYRLNERTLDQLNNWISEGGKLIVMDYALSSLEGKSGFSLQAKEQPPMVEQEEETTTPVYAEQRRSQISDLNAGAIFRVQVDDTHPLAYSLSDTYFSLKTGSDAYAPLNNGWTVGRLNEDLFTSGFVGARAKERLKGTLVFGSQPKGRGSVVYLVDNPLYRGFWQQGKVLFSNALFF